MTYIPDKVTLADAYAFDYKEKPYKIFKVRSTNNTACGDSYELQCIQHTDDAGEVVTEVVTEVSPVAGSSYKVRISSITYTGELKSMYVHRVLNKNQISYENLSSLEENMDTEIDTCENITEDEQQSVDEISEFHPGTVDNPFLYDATKPQLEKFLLTNVFVAGKNATIQQQKLNQFVECVRRDLGSYSVDSLGVLSAIEASIPAAELKDKVLEWLKEVKAGQYARISACIESICSKLYNGNLNLKDCTRNTLVSIKGIGYKTASMFLMYTKQNWPGACLDTHILKYLKEEGVQNVPDSTPAIKSDYIRLENEFAARAKIKGKKVAEFDFEIWSKYRQKVATTA